MAKVEDLYEDNLFALQYKAEIEQNSKYTKCIRCNKTPTILGNEMRAICTECLFSVRSCGDDLATIWNKLNTYERRVNYDLAQPMSERTRNRDYILEHLGLKEKERK